MLDAISISGTICVLIALGYVTVYLRVFTPVELRVFGRYIVNIALPALVFRAVAHQNLSEILNPAYLLGYLLGGLAMVAIGYYSSRHLLAQSKLSSTFNAMGMSCSNSGFFGYPILLMAMPAVAAKVLALNMIVENIVVIPLILIIAERANGTTRGWVLARQIAVNVIRQPLIIALMAGLVVSVFNLPLPEIVTKPIGLIADSSAAISLLVIGGTLVGLPLRALNLNISAVVMGKLVLMPLCMWASMLLVQFLGLDLGDPRLMTAAILVAATPAMGIYPILAQRYGQENNASLAMFAMTVLSFFSLSAVLLMAA